MLEKGTLEVFLNTVQCGIILFNNLKTEFLVNNKFREIFSDTRLNSAAKKPDTFKTEDMNRFNLFTPDGHELTYEDLPPVKAVRGEKVEDLEVVLKTEDTDKEKALLINSAPVYNGSGMISGSVTSILDVTQPNKIEKDLDKLLKGRKLISQEFNQRILNILYPLINLLKTKDEAYPVPHNARNQLDICLIRYINEIMTCYEDVEYFDFREYLQILCYEVYLINYNELIELEFEGSALITVDMLMLCGLVVNDILAYRLDSLGTWDKNKIIIEFNYSKGRITIKISDNGPVIPASVVNDTNTVKFASELLEQLSGFIKIETNEQRTVFQVEILYLDI